MSAQIDFRTLPLNVPSLCIPRVFSNINEARIRRILAELNLGDIARVDIVSNKSPDKDKSFNRVFIHFNKWNTNENANTARERLINGKDIKIIYDDPWFWVVFENTKQRLSRNDTRLMRLGYDAYLAAQVVEEHHRTLEEQHRILEEQHRTLKEQQRTLKEQNCSIQQLQSLCRKSGLNIPFWDAKHPPSITETEYETASAQTAIWAAESLLEEDGDEDACEVEAAYTAKRVAEAALDDDDAAYRVAESELDDDDAAEVDAAYLSSFGIAKCGNSGDEDDGYGDYDEDDGDGDYDEEDTCYKPYRTRVVYDDY